MKVPENAAISRASRNGPRGRFTPCLDKAARTGITARAKETRKGRAMQLEAPHPESRSPAPRSISFGEIKIGRNALV